ncbi:MAG TPA: F0F1 ATP synthase subunit delta [Steroidobacteraceae bacterium]
MTDKITIARPYARAAFAAAQTRGTLASWSDALRTAATVVGDPRVATLFGNPRVTAKALADFVIDIGGGKLGPEWNELVLALAENGRLVDLPEIATLFDALKDEADGVIDVTVTAATALDAKQQEALTAALTRRLKRQVRLHNEVDATLIGGAVIRAGDLVIDGSLRTRLERMAFELSA